MIYVLWGLGILAGLYCLHRAALWAERRGWIYYRKAGSSGAIGNAFLEIQATFDPAARHVQEERERAHSQTQESGDPPVPGPQSTTPEDPTQRQTRG
jgi:hypothetical protein